MALWAIGGLWAAGGAVACRPPPSGASTAAAAVATADTDAVTATALPGARPKSGAASRGAFATLRTPFDVELRRLLVGRPSPPHPARPRFEPIRDVRGVSFYVDDEKSIADPTLKQQNVAALQPLRDYVLHVVRLADGWVLSNPPQPEYAGAAIEDLSAWAKADALLGEVNRQGKYEREWTLGSLALAYLKVRDVPGGDLDQRAAVEAWLRRLALVMMPDYERPGLTSSSNNHAYWVGMAVAAAGISCDDRSLFEWGLTRARIGIAQVDADGVLPLERARRALALHYHVFALAPLVMLAEMAAANDVALYGEGGGAIRRLADLVMTAFANPVSFADRMQVPQEIKLPPGKTDLAWGEAYYARFRDPRLRAWLAGARPLFDVRLGGNMTASFGAPDL